MNYQTQNLIEGKDRPVTLRQMEVLISRLKDDLGDDIKKVDKNIDELRVMTAEGFAEMGEKFLEINAEFTMINRKEGWKVNLRGDYTRLEKRVTKLEAKVA